MSWKQGPDERRAHGATARQGERQSSWDKDPQKAARINQKLNERADRAMREGR
jgi:hypothetical protein